VAKNKRILDLCSGLGGAHQSFTAAGWEVLTVDIEKEFNPSIVRDVRNLSRPDRHILKDFNPYFIWASPPCTEFSRYSQPGLYDEYYMYKRGEWLPDMSIVKACKKIIDDLQPKYWCIENVRGAKKFISDELKLKPRVKLGSAWLLWGNFPVFSVSPDLKKNSNALNDPRKRAFVPLEISEGMLNAITKQLTLNEFITADKLK
jgi:hypothetical protein